MSANGSGRSVAWLARFLGVEEVESSNLSAPTIFRNLHPTILQLHRAVFSASVQVSNTKAITSPAQDLSKMEFLW